MPPDQNQRFTRQQDREIAREVADRLLLNTAAAARRRRESFSRVLSWRIEPVGDAVSALEGVQVPRIGERRGQYWGDEAAMERFDRYIETYHTYGHAWKAAADAVLRESESGPSS